MRSIQYTHNFKRIVLRTFIWLSFRAHIEWEERNYYFCFVKKKVSCRLACAKWNCRRRRRDTNWKQWKRELKERERQNMCAWNSRFVYIWTLCHSLSQRTDNTREMVRKLRRWNWSRENKRMPKLSEQVKVNLMSQWRTIDQTN